MGHGFQKAQSAFLKARRPRDGIRAHRVDQPGLTAVGRVCAKLGMVAPPAFTPELPLPVQHEEAEGSNPFSSTKLFNRNAGF
jgi:hypothetical protein